ncbi:MAG: hypothetical protein IH945_00955 [Armatimonadetes bacterium]|nr:hypothetical protein [Armatimonadota bacterium]
MRVFAAASALLAASFAVAQETAMGTKPDIVLNTPQQPAPIIGGWDLAQMLLALGIVFALLKWALPKVAARMNKKLVPSTDGSIRVEESATFGGGNLQIVTARGKTLLICVSQSGVTCLADLTDCGGASEEKAFFEIVDEAEGHAAVDMAEPALELPDMSSDEARAALDRLSRLTG